MSKKIGIDEVIGESVEYKRPGLSIRAVVIGLLVVIVLAVPPWIYDKVVNPENKYDAAVYTAKAVNFNTEQTLAVGNYQQLLYEYMGSYGMGYPGTEGGSDFWETEESFAPFLSINVDDFLTDTREALVQVKFLSLVVQWQELNTVLNAGLTMPDNYVEFDAQLKDMEEQIFNSPINAQYWDIPEDSILDKPLDMSYHAMMWYRPLAAEAEIFGTTDEIMFLHQYDGSPELTEWAFDEEAEKGDRAVINTLYGDIEVLLYGYVSTEDVEKYIESRKDVKDPREGQYYERLRQWSLLSS